jgi:hypothetical protein
MPSILTPTTTSQCVPSAPHGIDVAQIARTGPQIPFVSTPTTLELSPSRTRRASPVAIHNDSFVGEARLIGTGGVEALSGPRERRRSPVLMLNDESVPSSNAAQRQPIWKLSCDATDGTTMLRFGTVAVG